MLPGLFGRDPWKSADITAFGYMVNIAARPTPWLDADGRRPAGRRRAAAVLDRRGVRSRCSAPGSTRRSPRAFRSRCCWCSRSSLTWYATYHLARTESAQPLPFAFGGEAAPVDYARAIADGALLALIASLGLLQLGHETTPELAQLASVALFLLWLCGAAVPRVQARVALVLALPALAASGAPSIAMALGIVGAVLCRLSSDVETRRATLWVCASAAGGAIVAAVLGAWVWRLGRLGAPGQAMGLVRLLVWFTWPSWPLALWTLWRWRARLSSRHIVVPARCASATSLGACMAMGGSDRALMLGLPPLAVLAAFALPTLQRSTERGDRLVLGVLLLDCRDHHLGRLRLDRRPACRPSPRRTSPAWRRATRRVFSVLALVLRSGRHARLALAGALAHRDARVTRSGRAWCCRRAA